MEHPYERFWDRETRRHFDSRHAEGPYYGVVLNFEKEYHARQAHPEIKRMLGNSIVPDIDGARIIFSGPLGQTLVDALRKYVTSRDGISAKVFQGDYEHFVDDDPDSWNSRYLDDQPYLP